MTIMMMMIVIIIIIAVIIIIIIIIIIKAAAIAAVFATAINLKEESYPCCLVNVRKQSFWEVRVTIRYFHRKE